MISTDVLITIIVETIVGNLSIDISRILVCWDRLVRVHRITWASRIHAEIKPIMPTPTIVIPDGNARCLQDDTNMGVMSKGWSTHSQSK